MEKGCGREGKVAEGGGEGESKEGECGKGEGGGEEEGEGGEEKGRHCGYGSKNPS